MSTTIMVLMGVAGAGKTTVGQLLAAELGWAFLDADTLHPAANIEKMTRGIPLSDADREPWLAAVHTRIVEAFQKHEDLVVACSALKQRYRETLSRGVDVTWVYLKGSEEMIRARLQRRQHHFMKAQMLASQFADLEEPTDAIVVDIAGTPTAAVQKILNALSSRPAMQRASPQCGVSRNT
jgi:gluconokinase